MLFGTGIRESQPNMALDTDVLIIGAGMSGIGLAIQLQKTFRQASYEIIERTNSLGGTWFVNTYPGCGCDVASHFYSYSFELKPDWSRKFAPQSEILSYFRSVAEKHSVTPHIRYLSTVQSADFDETTGTWVVTIFDQESQQVYYRRSKILISAVGALSTPKECDIKGAENFQGKFFHSSKWDHGFDWADKEVVVVGNGCSATQFVPILTQDEGAVRKLTQFSRQPHWLVERPNPVYSPAFKLTMRCIPLAMRLYRFWQYYSMESDFFGFHTEKGKKVREKSTKAQLEYMKKTAPKRYHEALTPKMEFGCKRKVMDTDYLACLHRDNMELIHSDPIEEITATGVRTRAGRDIKADAIILANGFQTQRVLFPMEIRGERGISLSEHWDEFSAGAAEAYYGTCISRFPNFFIMMGPNTSTGHLSVIYSTECQINFTLRAIEPILRTLYPSTLSQLNPFSGNRPDIVAVTSDAERRENSWIQSLSKELVYFSGCTNWYVDARTKRNTMLYPDWQWKYWLRSIFIPFSSDFVFKSSPLRSLGANSPEAKVKPVKRAFMASGLGIIFMLTILTKLSINTNENVLNVMRLKKVYGLFALVRKVVGRFNVR